jgi:hypothetical protein
MTTEDHHERSDLTQAGRTDAPRAARHEAPLPWSAASHLQHAGRTLDGGPRSVLLDRTWSFEPASCLTGVRVVALRIADGVFVCPLCGLRTS